MIGPVNEQTLTSSSTKRATGVLIRRFSRACLRATDTTTRADHNVSKTVTRQKGPALCVAGTRHRAAPALGMTTKPNVSGPQRHPPDHRCPSQNGATVRLVSFFTCPADLETVAPGIATSTGHCVVSTAASSCSPPPNAIPNRALEYPRASSSKTVRPLHTRLRARRKQPVGHSSPD